MDYQIAPEELEKILTIAVRIGAQKGLEEIGERPKYVSQNKAYKKFTKARVRNWVEDGRIKPVKNGNGKTSTVQYNFTRLMELDASDTIIIRKVYDPACNQ
ncbi:MAG: hypothetical protein LBG96_03195 [Tannerella sp.]|jgi:hypothetical protein|nr:hypothetical protein [Tannerella sp.]